MTRIAPWTWAANFTAGTTTTAMAYNPITTCATTGAAAPCEEMDETQRLSAGMTVTTRHFYDG